MEKTYHIRAKQVVPIRMSAPRDEVCYGCPRPDAGDEVGTVADNTVLLYHLRDNIKDYSGNNLYQRLDDLSIFDFEAEFGNFKGKVDTSFQFANELSCRGTDIPVLSGGITPDLTIEGFFSIKNPSTYAKDAAWTLKINNTPIVLLYDKQTMSLKLHFGTEWSDGILSPAYILECEWPFQIGYEYHVAVTFSGTDNVWRLFLDGVQCIDTYQFSFITDVPNFTLGNADAAAIWHGTMYEVRLSDAVRYIGDFTPPDSPFDDAEPINNTIDPDILTLLHFGTDIYDYSEQKVFWSSYWYAYADLVYSSDAPPGGVGVWGNSLSTPQITCRSKVFDHNMVSGGMTFDFWFKAPSNTGQSLFRIDSPHSDGNFSLGVDFSSQLNLYSPWMGSKKIPTSLPLISANTWYHIAVIMDADTGNLFLALDGVIELMSNGSLKNIDYPVFEIGEGFFGRFRGLIAEFRITRKALWTTNFTRPSEPMRINSDSDNTISHYCGDSSSRDHSTAFSALLVQLNNDILDSSNTGVSPTYNSDTYPSPVFVNDSPFDPTEYSWDMSRASLTFPANSQWDWDGTTGFTMEGWFFLNSGYKQTLLMSMSTVMDFIGVILNTTGYLSFMNHQSDDVVPLATWFHIAMTFDKSLQSWSMWINGVRQSFTHDTSWDYQWEYNGAGGGTFKIGGDYWSSSPWFEDNHIFVSGVRLSNKDQCGGRLSLTCLPSIGKYTGVGIDVNNPGDTPGQVLGPYATGCPDENRSCYDTYMTTKLKERSVLTIKMCDKIV